MLEFLRRQLAKLLEERGALAAAVESSYAEARAESRDLTEAEQAARTEARAALVAHDEKIAEVRQNLSDAEEDERRSAEAARLASELGTVDTREERSASGGARVTSEPTTYRKGGQHSYFRDLMAINLNRADMSAAMERMRRNDREVEVETRALTTTDGGVGEFVPPLWMVQEYVGLARAGSVIADNVRQENLPSGTDSINLPKLATGTAVAEQATQNTAVQNTDATSTSVTANVATIAGQQVLAVQLIEQSPINMDTVILADLAADYATKKDVFVINNNAANKRGLLNVTGVVSVTYTDASPTVPELYPKVQDGIQQIHTNRFLPPQKVFMHPRRWAWFLSALDSQNRPLVTPYAAMNAAGAFGGVQSEGLVGELGGLPVYVDPSIPTNLGAGTNEDRIIIARTDDVILFEGTPRAEAFRETKADQLSVLLRFYNYIALHSERFPKSIAVISGTGLVAPTF